MHYRKIFDVTAAKSSSVGNEELLAADRQLRVLTRKGPRGPLAVVTDREQGELAQSFKALAADDRPAAIVLRRAAGVSLRVCCVREVGTATEKNPEAYAPGSPRRRA